jgi:hypothetical protein
MGRSAVLTLEVGSNDQLVLQVTSGIDPKRPVSFLQSGRFEKPNFREIEVFEAANGVLTLTRLPLFAAIFSDF